MSVISFVVVVVVVDVKMIVLIFKMDIINVAVISC